MQLPNKNNQLSISAITQSEEEKLIRDMNRTDMEKLTLFVKVLNREKLLKKAVIIYK